MIKGKIADTIGLNEREKSILQTTALNFAAMTNALIVKQDMVVNPSVDEQIGATLIYPKALENDMIEKMKSSLETRFSNFFQMANIDLELQIDFY